MYYHVQYELQHMSLGWIALQVKLVALTYEVLDKKVGSLPFYQCTSPPHFPSLLLGRCVCTNPPRSGGTP